MLGIDTSSAAVSAALFELQVGEVRLICERVTVNPRAHGELLTPSIEACLAQAGVTPRELGAIVVGLGPGPFTGLRVGLVTAAMLGELLAVPTYGVCSLDGLVADGDPDLLVAGDARRREVYWARYRDGVRVAGPAVARPADVRAKLAETGGWDEPKSGLVMTGAGARLYADVLGFPLRDREYPQLTALVDAAADRIISGAPSELLTPLYLRRPDALEPGARKLVTGKL